MSEFDGRTISPRFFTNPVTIMNEIPLLKMAVLDDELKDAYKTRVEKHNEMVINNSFSDSGFDLLTPEEYTFKESFKGVLLDMKIKCEMVSKKKAVGYYVYPRSSIYKTPLMLANSAGIIDSGYRGNIKMAFRLLGNLDYTVEKWSRMGQICMSTLEPFCVELVDECELSNTLRGDGGFGSTGK